MLNRNIQVLTLNCERVLSCMLQFHEPLLDDRQRAESFFFRMNHRITEYNFSDIFIWRNTFKTKIAFDENFLYVKLIRSGKTVYYLPVGSGDLRQAVSKLYEDAKASGVPFALAAVTPEMQEQLEELFPGAFEYIPYRDSYDYLYLAEDLITLKGKKLHSKRNHVTRFRNAGDWAYEVIDENNMPECIALNDLWCSQNGCGQSEEMRAEYCSVRQAIKYYKELGLVGGLLRQNDRVVAFSIGQKLCEDTFIVHIEKALSEVEGAYAAINQEFCIHNCEGFVYVNREDDAGEEGLRKAKLSYHPAMLLEKSTAVLKEGAIL